ncbi:hypothetical protein [Priestia aryabhattai]|uniref:hypothetical protein n=1 Tax=Priestia aryabhattai TaxID=412384 RepID=UPI002E24D1EE|nr:hypothetical protein [Priestia aryabhattai]
MKENKLKTFSIIHDKQSILLETSHTKFYSLERLLILISKEFIRRGKQDALRNILLRIEGFLL